MVWNIFRVVSSFYNRAEEKKKYFGVLQTVPSTEQVHTHQFNCSQHSALTTKTQNAHVLNEVHSGYCFIPYSSCQPERQTSTCMQTAYFHPKLTPWLETACLTSFIKALKSGREFGAAGYKDHRLNQLLCSQSSTQDGRLCQGYREQHRTLKNGNELDRKKRDGKKSTRPKDQLNPRFKGKGNQKQDFVKRLIQLLSSILCVWMTFFLIRWSRSRVLHQKKKCSLLWWT